MSNHTKNGVFTISLDFEIHWGVSDHRTIEGYRENLENVPKVVERLLDLFEKRKIHATWATVGMLFGDTKTELKNMVPPGLQPTYLNPKYSNYPVLEMAGENIIADPFHFALPLIQKIQRTSGQEIGSHTFSHFYCLERGQTLEQLRADLVAAKKMAKKMDVELKTIIFPRNQYDEKTLEICRELGFSVFRGNENHWIYEPRNRENETLSRRFARLLDTYINLSGNNTHLPTCENGLWNVPSSRFLRPFSPKLAVLDGLRFQRIKNEMTRAARQKRLFHLWWHPHNFGKYMDQNFKFLEKVLDHFENLRQREGFESLNMFEIANQSKFSV